MLRFKTFLTALAGAVALTPAVAAAQVETEGTGAGIEHVRNIPYPNLHEPEEKNAGTDLEFVTLTITPAVAAAAPPAPAVTTKAKRKLSKACRKAKTAKKKHKRKKWARTCAAQKRAKAKKSDARSAPGVQRTFALAGSYGDGMHIIDVTDPANSQLVATWDCGVSQADVQIFQRPDLGNRWFATLTHDDGYDFHKESQCATDLAAKGVTTDGPGTYIADITDPYHPKTVSFVPFGQGSHNMTVHPSGRYLYNSNSDLITSPLPAVEIADITDIEQPKQVGEFPLLTLPGLGTEAHDIGFNDDGTRAYVAALSHGEILDTTDPANPTRAGTVIDPSINVWHQTEEFELDGRTYLIAEDEFAGAVGTGQCPNGGVHIYDITGPLEATPQKVGAWNIADVGPTDETLGSCTAHVFQVHEQEKLMTIAFYNGGVRVVDLSSLTGVALGDSGMGLKEVGSYRFPDSDTWAVKAPVASRDGFYLYGNDHSRGFDVYRWKPGATSSRGVWRTPQQTLDAAAGMQRWSDAPVAERKRSFVCLLTQRT